MGSSCFDVASILIQNIGCRIVVIEDLKKQLSIKKVYRAAVVFPTLKYTTSKKHHDSGSASGLVFDSLDI